LNFQRSPENNVCRVAPFLFSQLSMRGLAVIPFGGRRDGEITADCPKKQAHNMNDPCGARCPDLPRVL
jgi:hypothetical protein